MTPEEFEDQIEEIESSLQEERLKLNPNRGIIFGLLTELGDAKKEYLEGIREERKRWEMATEDIKLMICVLRKRNFLCFSS